MRYSREFIALNIEYVKLASQKTGVDLIETIKTITCIRRTILGAGFNSDPRSQEYWQRFVDNPGIDIVATIMDIQANAPAHFSEEERVRSGRLSATLPNKDGLSLIHFSSDENEVKPLGEEGLKKRAAELTSLLRLLKESGPVNIGMFSWLLDGRFSFLFPLDTEYLNNPNNFYQSLAVWGQYLRANGSLNSERASLLVSNAERAQNIIELQSSHPKKALQARVPAQKIYDMYGIK